MDQDQSDKPFAKCLSPMDSPWIIQGPGLVQQAILQSASPQGQSMDNPGTRISPTSHFAKCLSPIDSPWIIQGPGSVRQGNLQSASPPWTVHG